MKNNSIRMSRVCYLHVGLPKTASSSFQATCKINADLLQDSKINYPCFSCAAANKSKIYNHSVPIRSLFTEDPGNYRMNKRWGVSNNIEEVNSSYDDQLSDYLASSDNLIISGESISLLSEESLLKLINKIKYYNYEIKVLALVRSPYAMICSAIQQSIKTGEYFKLISLNDCIPTSFSGKQLHLKSKTVEKLISVFGKSICFHSFDRACTHSHGPVGFLLEEFLNQDPSIFEYQKNNESLSNLSVRMQNEFNAVNPAFVGNKNGNKYNTKFRRFPLKVDEKLGFSGKFLLTEVEYGLVEEFVKIETENLNEIIGLDFSGQSLKFSKPIFLT